MTVTQAAEAATTGCHYFSIHLDDDNAIDLVTLEDHMKVLKRWIIQAQECDLDAQRWRRRYHSVVRALWAAAGAILMLMGVVARMVARG